MKKIFLIVITSLGFITIGFAQPCLPDGIAFTTQAQIDSFPINYPNVSVVEGLISIKGNDITNLDSLIYIDRISGGISIKSTKLQGLSGLNNLNFLGGSLYLEENNDLLNLNGLESLDTITGGIGLRANSIITNFSGLTNLKRVGGGLIISWNHQLVDFSGMDSLKIIGGEFYLTYNWSLLNFHGLNKLKSIGGSLTLAWNYEMTNVEGLNGLNYIGGDLQITQNYGIKNLDGLSNLDSIDGRLYINQESALINISGLANINAASIKDLIIHNNISLASCNAQSICDYLSSPNGKVIVYNNATGCSSPGEIADYCDIELQCLPYGDYYFTKQSTIDSFQTDFPNCHSPIGDVYISGDDITNLNGLSNLDTITEALTITDNPLLVDLNGLEQLKYAGVLHLGYNYNWFYRDDGNPLLSDLTALSNLDHVTHFIVVAENPLLTSLAGLENIGEFWSLEIYGNESLSNCAIESVCNHLLSTGYYEIYDNAPGCNSDDEVREACLVSVEKEHLLHHIKFSPNPFTYSTTIEYHLNQPSEVTLSIFNHLGKQVDLIRQHQQPGKQSLTWQPQGLPPGLYYFTLQAGDQVAIGKMVMVR